jgi:hypothetical protein
VTDHTADWVAGLVGALTHGSAGGRAGLSPTDALVRTTTRSGADVVLAGDVVVRLHHPRTDAVGLSERLAWITREPSQALWVQPLEAGVLAAPDGRVATVWPRVDVLTDRARPLLLQLTTATAPPP